MRHANQMLAAGLVLCLAGCAGTAKRAAGELPHFETEPRAPGWHETGIETGGITRWFRYFVPSNLPPRPAAVLVLHGSKQGMRPMFTARDGGARAWIGLAETDGFLLVAPNGVNVENGDTRGESQNWNDLRPAGTKRRSTADDIAFIGALLDWLQTTCATDPRRVYVTGASNGGAMTYRLVLAMPERFAAAAAFVATLPAGGGLTPPSRPVPLLIANGTADPIVKWDGGPVPGGGPVQLSTPETVAWWVKANRARMAPVAAEQLPDTDPKDRCRIVRELHPAGEGGAPVLFYRIEGGGHAMPSRLHGYREGPLVQDLLGIPRDAEGAALAWDFMKQFTAPAVD